MNPKIFFKKWKKGIETLSPAQILQAKMTGHLGGAIGLVLAIISMWLRDFKAFTVFLIFMTWLQIVEYVSTKKNYEAAKNLIDLQHLKEVEEKL